MSRWRGVSAIWRIRRAIVSILRHLPFWPRLFPLLTPLSLSRSHPITFQPQLRIKVVDADLRGSQHGLRLVKSFRILLHPNVGIVDDLLDVIEEILRVVAALRVAHPDVVALGVGLPGFVDSVNGIVHELTNVPGWHEVPLRSILAERTGLILADQGANVTVLEANSRPGDAFFHIRCRTMSPPSGIRKE